MINTCFSPAGCMCVCVYHNLCVCVRLRVDRCVCVGMQLYWSVCVCRCEGVCLCLRLCLCLHLCSGMDACECIQVLVWVKGIAKGLQVKMGTREMLLLLNITFTISGNTCNAV